MKIKVYKIDNFYLSYRLNRIIEIWSMFKYIIKIKRSFKPIKQANFLNKFYSNLREYKPTQ
jgi:hypothetical protein